jgi:VanZ family protein
MELRPTSIRGTQWIADLLRAGLTAVRIMAWLSAAALVFLTLSSPGVRFETAVSHNFEHFAAFGASGLSFSIGYRRRLLIVLVGGLGSTTILEALQIWAPDRHARWLDLLMNSAGFCIGVFVPVVISVLMMYLRAPRCRAGNAKNAAGSTAARLPPGLATTREACTRPPQKKP